MGGKIDCYLDIASFFSYVAFADLDANLAKLEVNGVEVNFRPVLIAGVNQLSGNQPPWKLKAKAKYLATDTQRALRRVSLHGLAFPADFLSRALTTSPLRALLYIKAHHPRAVFVSAMRCLFDLFWRPPHVNLTLDAELARALAMASEGVGRDGQMQGAKLFSGDDVDGIMKGREEMKGLLKTETAEVVQKKGAFGMPWLWVTNGEGKEEAFFGSDRFNHVYAHLGIPFTDVAVLPPAKL